MPEKYMFSFIRTHYIWSNCFDHHFLSFHLTFYFCNLFFSPINYFNMLSSTFHCLKWVNIHTGIVDNFTNKYEIRVFVKIVLCWIVVWTINMMMNLGWLLLFFAVCIRGKLNAMHIFVYIRFWSAAILFSFEFVSLLHRYTVHIDTSFDVWMCIVLNTVRFYWISSIYFSNLGSRSIVLHLFSFQYILLICLIIVSFIFHFFG